MTTIAFHGDFATPVMLAEDIGQGVPIDLWADTTRLTPYRLLDRFRSVALVGYSRGGALIADLSVECDNIRCAVLYESPLGMYGRVGGSFPVMIIWNDRGRYERRKAQQMEEAWQANGRSVTHLWGRGRHIRIDRSMSPPIRHGWDRSLNPQIAEFLRTHNAQQPNDARSDKRLSHHATGT